MEHRQLQAFIAVAADLDYSIAAEKLRYSTEELLRDLELLEDVVGCSLLRAQAGKPTLTGAGAVFLPKAEAILAAGMQHTRELKKITGGKAARLLRVACTPETCWTVPLRMAQEAYFHQGHARQLRVTIMPCEEILPKLRARRVDLALMAEVDLAWRIEFHVRRIQIRATRTGKRGERERQLVRYAVWRHKTEIVDYLSAWVDGMERKRPVKTRLGARP